MMDKCYIIPVQEACNADCAFCISKSRNYNKSVELMLIDKKFTKTLQMLKNRGINRFEITGGGEPFLHPKIESIISKIRYMFPSAYIKIYTNGRIFKDVRGVDELNISVASNDKSINDRIMGGVDNKSLLDKVEYFKKLGVKVRLSIPLIKGCIDSKTKIENLINSVKVDEYVFRTLYPHSPNMEDYVDVEYEKDNVIIERDNGLDSFDGIILWSDGKLYRNFNLDKERILTSYMLLKPDSRTYVNEIFDYLESENFIIHEVLHINDIKNKALPFYKDKEERYFKEVEEHLNRSSFLFGNNGLILLLDKNESYESLLSDTYNAKKKIRSLFGFSNHYGCFLTDEKLLTHLNLVHAPDVNITNYERDINYINSLKLRRLESEEVKLIRRYRSYDI